MIDSPFSRRFPFVALAWHNLSRANARSILATAGITIGVIAIASLGMFGAAYEQSVRNTFDDTVSQVYVSPGEDASFDAMTRTHVQEIERTADGDVYPVGYFTANVTGLAAEDARVTMVSLDRPSDFYDIASGDVDGDWRSGVIIGSEVAERLEVDVGDGITVDGNTRRVHAVLQEAGRGQVLPVDDAIVVPQSRAPSKEYQLIIVRSESPQKAFETSNRMELNGREERYSINDAEEGYEQLNQQLNTFNMLLIGIGGVSLLVASVSILNVMLMSTIERKEEIGVMRAVGYHRLDVLRLMLVEASLLGVIGAVVGVAISVLMGMAINAELLNDPLAFTTDAITYTVLGFLFGTLASFVSGVYPAWKAANARPVEALRD